MENKQKLIFEGGVGPVICATRDCNKVLLRLHKAYWLGIPTKIKCQRCAQEIFFMGVLVSPLEEGWIAFRFFCKTCQEAFDRKIPVKTRSCHGCKVDISIYPLLDALLPYVLQTSNLLSPTTENEASLERASECLTTGE